MIKGNVRDGIRSVGRPNHRLNRTQRVSLYLSPLSPVQAGELGGAALAAAPLRRGEPRRPPCGLERRGMAPLRSPLPR
jgi:hypothetical protein